MSSGFVTETEIAAARRKRQEEWEKVRQADQPLEAPEEDIVYDRRSLFERLQEQKQKKDLEYEEAHKLKNMIKGLDDDEIEFLDLVDRTKLAAERKKTLDEERELNDYRNRVATLQEKTLDKRLHPEVMTGKQKAQPPKHSQIKLLQGAVVRKNEPKKRKLSETEDNEKEVKDKENMDERKRKLEEMEDNTDSEENSQNEGALKCIGILPGLGHYNDSSDSEMSSDSDQEPPGMRVDMLGRKLPKKKEEN